jgi:hypothetical protein
VFDPKDSKNDRVVFVRQINPHLYNVSIDDGHTVFELDNHGFDELMQFSDQFKTKWMQ